MAKIVVKDRDKGLAIFTGLFFLLCTFIKIVTCVVPVFISEWVSSPLAAINIFVFAEIFVYFSLTLQAFSCKRSGALLIPISIMFMQFIFSLITELYSLISGYSANAFASVLMILFSLAMLFALILICLEINLNVSTQRRVVLKILAILAILAMIFGYLCYLVGDIFIIFAGTTFVDSLNDWRLIVMYIVLPIVEDIKILIMCFGMLLMCCWMATRHKYVELKEHKITDEELYSDLSTKKIKVAPPSVVKTGDGVDADENIE